MKKKKLRKWNWKHALLVCVAACALIYWIGSNVFLNSSAFRSLLAEWDDGILVYSWIVSPVPGVAYVSAAGVTHQDRHVRWNVTTDHALIVFSPFDLFFKKVRFYRVSIGNAHFRFVMKKNVDAPRSKTALDLAFYPAIAFGKAVKKKKPEPSGKPGSKWGIQMSGVSIGKLQEAWVNEYRYTGGMGIDGEFRIVPDKEVEVGPATVRFYPGEFFLGQRKIAEQMEGQLHYHMEPFDPNADDPTILKSVSLRAELSARPDTLDPLNIYFSSLPWFRLGEGAGVLGLDLRVKAGRIVGPGKISFETEALKVQLGKFNATGGARLSWNIEEGSSPKSSFKGGLKNAQIGYRTQASFLTGARLDIEGHSDDLDFEHLFDALDLSMELTGAKARDYSLLNSFLPPASPIKFDSGVANIALKLQTHSKKPGEDRGYLRLDGEKSGVLMKKQSLVGKLAVNLPFEKSRLSKGQLHFVGASVSLLDGVVAGAVGSTPSSWWAQVTVPQADFNADPTRIRADFRVLMRNSLPLVPLVASHASLLSKILNVENIKTEGRFSVYPGGFDLTGLKFDSSSLKVEGFYTEKEDVAFARMLIVLNPFAVGLYIVNSDTRLILNDAFNWYKAAPKTAVEIQTEPITQ